MTSNITLSASEINFNGVNTVGVGVLESATNLDLTLRTPTGSASSISLAPKNVTALTVRDDAVCIFNNAPRLSVGSTITGNVTLVFPLDSLYIIFITGTTTGTITLPLPASGINDGTQVIFKRRSGSGTITFNVSGGGSNIISKSETTTGASASVNLTTSPILCQTIFICAAALWYQIDAQ